MEDSFNIPDRNLFSSTHFAVKSLQRLRIPPNPPNLSDPSPVCRSALDILAFLAFHNTTSRREEVYYKGIFLKNWTASIGAWVKYFFEEFALAQELPTTQHGLEFRDRILYVLPIILASGNNITPPKRGSSFCRFFRNQGQFLLPLIARVWLRLQHTHHAMTFKWAAFLLSILHTGDIKLFEKLTGYIISDPDSDIVALGIEELGNFATKYRISTVDIDPTLAGLYSTMDIISLCSSTSTAIHSAFLTRGGVSAVVKVLSGKLLRPPLSRHLNRVGHRVFTTATAFLKLLKQFLDHPFSASEALQAGLFKFIVGAAEYYADGEMGAELGIQNLGDVIGEVLERISRLLVYPSVLRRFKRSITKYVTTEWESSLEGRHEFLSEVWESCMENVDCLDDIREDLKVPGLGLCDYDECSNNDMDVKFQRCSSCGTVIYCSYACAKKNWPRHKADCLTASEVVKGGTVAPDSIALAIFNETIDYYVDIFCQDISDGLNDFRAGNKEGARPVVVLDFDSAELDTNVGHRLMDLSCFNIMDREDIIQDERVVRMNLETQIIGYTSSSEEEDPLEVVVTFFPSVSPCSLSLGTWPIVRLVAIPDGDSESFCNDEESEYNSERTF